MKKSSGWTSTPIVAVIKTQFPTFYYYYYQLFTEQNLTYSKRIRIRKTKGENYEIVVQLSCIHVLTLISLLKLSSKVAFHKRGFACTIHKRNQSINQSKKTTPLIQQQQNQQGLSEFKCTSSAIADDDELEARGILMSGGLSLIHCLLITVIIHTMDCHVNAYIRI